MSLSICSRLAAILNAKFLPAAIIHVSQIIASYLSVHYGVRYGIVTTYSVYGTAVTLGL